jgi:hypothetical protein
MKLGALVQALQRKDQTKDVEFIIVTKQGEVVAMGIEAKAAELANMLKMFGASETPTETAYLVWHPEVEEGVVFSARDDAEYAATGNSIGSKGVSALADSWRDIYAEGGEQFPVQNIDIRLGEES